jgi:hypothetical protein
MATNLYLQGLGGGTMQSYLDATCPASQLLTVEASPGVLEAARRFFGFSGGAATRKIM